MNKIEVHVIGDFQREKIVTGTLLILGRGTEHINVLSPTETDFLYLAKKGD